jgi:Zn-dependent peptidase ImmA (M78 family)/transcriptional regulator with XRE-family HTH domain
MSAILELAPVALGHRLTEARKTAGLTQQQAAEQLGVSRPTLIGIEKGTRKARPEEIVALAGIYRHSVHDLMRQGPDTPALEPHLRAALGADDSPAVAAAIQTLQAFANDYQALEDLAGTEPFRDFPPEAILPRRADLRAFAEDVAIRERSRLHLGDQPIFDLRSLVEQAGVHCFFGDIPSTLAGLYAFVPQLGYCILINRKHPAERRRWTLAHEYAHFLADRHKPGVDYIEDARRKPVSERFADAFAASLLMPETAIRRGFLAVTERTGDFQTADLTRLAHQFHVSAQAAALRLEQLGLLPNGTWEALTERGFKPGAARRLLGLEPSPIHEDVYPERYRYLAVQAYVRERISEGSLARFLRTDRVTAREIVEATLTSRDLDAQGHACAVQIPEQLSLFDARTTWAQRPVIGRRDRRSTL